MSNRPDSRNRPSEQGRPSSFNRQFNNNRAGSPNRPEMYNNNRPGFKNKPSEQGKSGSFNRQFNNNRPGSPHKPGMSNRPGSPNRPGMSNRPGSRLNNQKSSGIRKPVSPSELLQLQKTNKSEKEKAVLNNKEKQNIETPKQKVKAPNSRPNSSSSKKTPHRTFSNSSKKSGRTDWDDSAKLDALRNKNPQKQRQKVHIIGENDDSLTSETSGYSGEKITILSASLARPKKEKSTEPKSQNQLSNLRRRKRVHKTKAEKKSYGIKGCKRS